jgi:hypothetical protein
MAPGDPRSWRRQVEAWVHGELRAWFEDARTTDLARAQAWRAVRDGRPPMSGPPAGGGGTVPHFMVLAAAGADPVVGRAVLRHMHLVDPPAALDAVRPRVADMLAGGWLPGRPAPRPDGGAPPGAATGPRPAPERPAGPPPGAPVAPPRRRLVEVLASVEADAVPS